MFLLNCLDTFVENQFTINGKIYFSAFNLVGLISVSILNIFLSLFIRKLYKVSNSVFESALDILDPFCIFINIKVNLCLMWYTPLIPVLNRQRPVDLCEF